MNAKQIKLLRQKIKEMTFEFLDSGIQSTQYKSSMGLGRIGKSGDPVTNWEYEDRYHNKRFN